MASPRELNTFNLQFDFEDPNGSYTDPTTGKKYVKFECDADTSLNDADTVGLVQIIVNKYVNGNVTEDEVSTYTGQSTTVLSSGTIYCLALEENGKDVYYKVTGGLPDGEYLATCYCTILTASQFNPRLTAVAKFKVENDKVPFVNP